MVKLLSRRMIKRIRSLSSVRNRLLQEERRRQYSDDEDEIIDLSQFPELFEDSNEKTVQTKLLNFCNP